MANKQSSQNKANLLIILFSALILAVPHLSWAGGPPPTSSGKPVSTPEPTNSGKPVSTPEPTNSGKPVSKPEPTKPPMTGAPAPTTAPTTDDTEKKGPLRFPYPSANIEIKDGSVTIRLKNESDFELKYQAIGATKEKVLGAKTQVDLEVLPVPANLTFTRSDGGLLLVTPTATDTPGVLEITFTSTDKMDSDSKSMTIEKDGGVFLN